MASYGDKKTGGNVARQFNTVSGAARVAAAAETPAPPSVPPPAVVKSLTPVEERTNRLIDILCRNMPCDMGEVARLLDGGVDVDAKESGATDISGGHQARPLLVLAAVFKHDADYLVLRTLLAKGADTDARCAAGKTPLMHAAHSGNIAVADILLQAGADLEAEQNPARRVRALAIAAFARKTDMMLHLLQKGADDAARFRSPANGELVTIDEWAAQNGIGGIENVMTSWRAARENAWLDAGLPVKAFVPARGFRKAGRGGQKQ